MADETGSSSMGSSDSTSQSTSIPSASEAMTSVIDSFNQSSSPSDPGHREGGDQAASQSSRHGRSVLSGRSAKF
jgi:hypothetical protein